MEDAPRQGKADVARAGAFTPVVLRVVEPMPTELSKRQPSEWQVALVVLTVAIIVTLFAWSLIGQDGLLTAAEPVHAQHPPHEISSRPGAD